MKYAVQKGISHYVIIYYDDENHIDSLTPLLRITTMAVKQIGIFLNKKRLLPQLKKFTNIKGIEIGFRMINVKNYQVHSLRLWFMTANVELNNC